MYIHIANALIVSILYNIISTIAIIIIASVNNISGWPGN